MARRLVCLVRALWGASLPLAGTLASDRGIGGTGGPAVGPEMSDRGIGGTGIVGVITGFGSVVVNGLEIAYSPTTPVTVDGVSDTASTLRFGQLVAIADSDDQGWHATAVAVRHEVSGPVTSLSDGGGPGGQTLTVAGQRIAIGPDTVGPRTVRAGEWLAVSGLRQPDGVIAASRIDLGTRGAVLVRGPTMPSGAGWQIGGLPVRHRQGPSLRQGRASTPGAESWTERWR